MRFIILFSHVKYIECSRTMYLITIENYRKIYDSGDFKCIRALIHPFELLRL